MKIPSDQVTRMLSLMDEWGFIDGYRFRHDGDHEAWVKAGYSFHWLGGKVEELAIALMCYRYGSPLEAPDEPEVNCEPIDNVLSWSKLLVNVYAAHYPGFDEYWNLAMRAGIANEYFHHNRVEFDKLVFKYKKKFKKKDSKQQKEWLPTEIRLRKR